MWEEGAETGAEVYQPQLKFLWPPAATSPSPAAPLASPPTPRPSPRRGWSYQGHCGSAWAGSQRLVPRLCARLPNGLSASPRPPAPAPTPSPLAARSWHPFVANKLCGTGKGRGAGPRAQKRGWAPGVSEPGNRVVGGNLGGAEEEKACWRTCILRRPSGPPETSLGSPAGRAAPRDSLRHTQPLSVLSSADSQPGRRAHRGPAASARKHVLPRGSNMATSDSQTLVHTDIQVHADAHSPGRERGRTRRQGEPGETRADYRTRRSLPRPAPSWPARPPPPPRPLPARPLRRIRL